MHNDKSTSELVSQSLSGHLSSVERVVIEEKLADSEQTRNFAKISKIIQDSLSDVARLSVEGDESVAPGLPEDSRERIKRSIRVESARRSQMQMARTVTTTTSTQDAPTDHFSGSRFDVAESVDETDSRRPASAFQRSA